jgi:hypothetical protein
MEYGTRSKRYMGVQDRLVQFAQPYTGNTQDLLGSLMNGVWRSLGPAAAPERSMIEEAE